jgi:hypothetical protein
MYKLQRKNIDQSNEEFIFNEDETTCIQLIMIWKVNNSSKKFWVTSRLIEHDKDRDWCREGSMKLVKHYKLTNIQHGPIEETYLMHDNIVLIKRVNVIREGEYYKLEMIISEGNIKDNTQRIQYIDMDR